MSSSFVMEKERQECPIGASSSDDGMFAEATVVATQGMIVVVRRKDDETRVRRAVAVSMVLSLSLN